MCEMFELADTPHFIFWLELAYTILFHFRTVRGFEGGLCVGEQNVEAVDVPLDNPNQLGDLLDWFDGPIDWYDHLGWNSQPNEFILLQNIEVQSQNEQQGGAALKTLNVENEMVGFSNRDYVPLDTTNPFGDFLDWFDGPIDDCSDLVCWTSQR